MLPVLLLLIQIIINYPIYTNININMNIDINIIFKYYNSPLNIRILIIITIMKKQKVEDTYKKLTQIQHILLRPDTYIGSVQMTEEAVWTLDQNQAKLEFKKIKYIPGLYKIFDQVLVNAADNYQRDGKMTKIDVTIDASTGMITVMNDGKSIPAQLHKDYKIYVAQLIFGHLLTSSNYEDKKKKVTGGRNGYGAKLTNIFSQYFCVQTADSANRKLLTIQWTKNMSKMKGPQTVVYQGKDYTKVTFKPDYQKFGIQTLTPQMISLFKKRVYDMAGILKCSVFLNEQLVNVHNFHQYVKMYLKNSENEELIFDKDADSKRWSVVVTKSEGQFQQISFVNAICTINGGTHVNKICDQIVQKLMPQLMKKQKDLVIKPFQIKSHFQIFINSLIQNPAFNSQSKDTLTSNVSTFGSQYQVSDKLVKDILKSGIAERILASLRNKQNSKIERELKKFKKNQFHLVIPKLEDANLAGKAKGCTLILTQGDSAKALAMCGIQKLGRDYYGVFPLRGKVINVRDMTYKQVMENFELANVVKIVGLNFGKKYTNTNDLRYSSVMIMADQDTDGSHIKGLLLNFFYTFWPSLCQIKGFLKQFITPIIRCRRGNETVDFFSTGEYELWKIDNETDWKIKYYKGLGTSTSKQGQQYFSNLQKHQIEFQFLDNKDKQCFDLAFGKKNADQRKRWLQEFNQTQNLDYNIKNLKVEDFFNKQFRHFSIYDNVRSIPSIMDGLKPSQRKILFACFKRNLKNEIKVAQLAGYVAEHSAYHHGQISLCSTIVSMAQNYIGSNNLPLLQPIGQFGTRHMNGKDSASPRYLHTTLSSLCRYIFPQSDDHIVPYQQQQCLVIQPSHYYPILPLILINGAQGIGTGWSTTVYPHRVQDVLDIVKDRLQGDYRFISIGWEGYQGDIAIQRVGVFGVKGKCQIIGDNTVTITQIPINKSIRDYKAFLQQKVKSIENQDPDIEQIREYHSGDKVQFVITFVQGRQPQTLPQLQKYLKLQTKLTQTNMTMFNTNTIPSISTSNTNVFPVYAPRLQRYQTIADILQQFYTQRIAAYRLRRKYLISKYRRQMEILQAKIRFINDVMGGKYGFMEGKDAWVRRLAADKYRKYSQFHKVQSTKLNNNNQQPQQQTLSSTQKQYNYLLSIPIFSFCQQKVVQLESSYIQSKNLIAYYQVVKEQELWRKDLQDFEQAWAIYRSVKEGNISKIRQQEKQRQRERNQTSRTRRKAQVQNNKNVKQQMRDESLGKPAKKVKLQKKNLIQQQLQNDEVFNKLNAKKSGKDDWYRYEPIKVPQPAKEQDKISSLLSKYLSTNSNEPANNDFASRIRARVLQMEENQNQEAKLRQDMVNEQQKDNNLGMDQNADKNKRQRNVIQNGDHSDSEDNDKKELLQDEDGWLQ